MKKFAIALVAGLFAAQSFGAMLSQGTREIAFGGSIDDVSGEMEYDFGAGFGFFILDGVEVGLSGSIYNYDELSVYGIGAFAELNLDLGAPVVPYLGARGTYVMVDMGALGDDTALEGAGYAGGKLFIVDNVALYAQFEFLMASEEIYAGEGEMEDTDWKVTFGTRFMF